VDKLPPNFTKIIESILEENETFCKSNEIGHETWVEIVELMNDAIDNVVWEVKEIDWRNLFSKYAKESELLRTSDSETRKQVGRSKELRSKP
jgi:hypothetical protein